MIVLSFNECINKHDVKGLSKLMTKNHTFIDRDSTIHQSREFMMKAWEQFFQMYPLYKNIFNRIESRDNSLIIIGHAYWSEEQPHDAVIWVATILDDLVSEWRIYDDSPANRTELNVL